MEFKKRIRDSGDDVVGEDVFTADGEVLLSIFVENRSRRLLLLLLWLLWLLLLLVLSNINLLAFVLCVCLFLETLFNRMSATPTIGTHLA